MRQFDLSVSVRRLFALAVPLALLLSPTQWSLTPKEWPHVTPGDLMLVVAGGLFALRALLLKKLPRLPPWPHFALLLTFTLALVPAADKREAFKEIIQVGLYFVLGTMVLEGFMDERPAKVRISLAALAAGGVLSLILAMVQYCTPGVESLMVRGMFGNSNVLGGFLALMLPFCCAGILVPGRLWLRTSFLIVLMAGMVVNLSGASYLAIMGVFLAMALYRGWRPFIVVAVGMLLWQNVVMPLLPRENDLQHLRSMALYDENGVVERRYPEWQAACNMVLTHPWLGVGAGNYQKRVGEFFDTIPRRTGPAEPDTQNLYLVLAASCGLPALLAFLAVLFHGITPPLRNHQGCSGAQLIPRYGVVGGLIAFALTALWHPLLIRGIGLPLVFVLALSRSYGCERRTDG